MYSCFIIDDEPHCIKGLEEFINKMPELVLIGSFESPLLALEAIRTGQLPDVVFLDINMQELSGLSVADLLPKESSIVFTTGHPKYAINGFEKDAVDFLLKPYSFENFVKTITKVRRRIGVEVQIEKPQVKSIFINPGTKGAFNQIILSEILYIEAKDHSICINVQTEMINTNLTLKEILAVLSDKNFIRVHRSYVVNIENIKSIENSEIKLKTNIKIPLSPTYRDELLQRIKHQTIKAS